MRKRDPNVVIDQFQAELASSTADWSALSAGAPRNLAQRASVDAFTRAAVAFERFRSDWHIAAITRDATVFRSTQLNRVHTALKETKRDPLSRFVRLDLPVHPTLAEVAALLDATGGNISLPTIAAWKDRAAAHLAEPWVSKVAGIAWAHEVAGDAVIAIRNAASHQSPRSVVDMNAALAKLTHPSIHRGLARPARQVTVTGIPTYIHGSIAGRPPRVRSFISLVDRLSEGLRV